MRTAKIAILAGLKSDNVDTWKGKVLLYGREYHGIVNDGEIEFVQYDPKDGRSPIVVNADKIRNIKGIWRMSKSKKWFIIYNERDLI